MRAGGCVGSKKVQELLKAIADLNCAFNPYKNFTWNFKSEINISLVNYFNSIWEIRISKVKLIFICECLISYVKHMFRLPGFQMWDFEPVPFSCGLGISYGRSYFTFKMKVSQVKIFQFLMLFTCKTLCEFS